MKKRVPKAHFPYDNTMIGQRLKNLKVCLIIYLYLANYTQIFETDSFLRAQEPN